MRGVLRLIEGKQLLVRALIELRIEIACIVESCMLNEPGDGDGYQPITSSLSDEDLDGVIDAVVLIIDITDYLGNTAALLGGEAVLEPVWFEDVIDRVRARQEAAS
jgi:hypothetical protein